MKLSPYQRRKILKAYNEYTSEEFSNEPIKRLPKDGILDLAYTTYEFDDDSKYSHEIQVSFDLNTMSCKSYIDDELVIDEPWDYETLIGNLECADFDAFISDCVHKGFSLEEENHFEEWKKEYDSCVWVEVSNGQG